MRNELPEHHLPALSTRMIFLHHRVRMHDHALRQGGADEPAATAARIWLAALLLAAAALFGVFHA